MKQIFCCLRYSYILTMSPGCTFRINLIRITSCDLWLEPNSHILVIVGNEKTAAKVLARWGRARNIAAQKVALVQPPI